MSSRVRSLAGVRLLAPLAARNSLKAVVTLALTGEATHRLLSDGPMGVQLEFIRTGHTRSAT